MARACWAPLNTRLARDAWLQSVAANRTGEYSRGERQAGRTAGAKAQRWTVLAAPGASRSPVCRSEWGEAGASQRGHGEA